MTWLLRKLAVGLIWLGMQALVAAIYYDDWRRE